MVPLEDDRCISTLYFIRETREEAVASTAFRWVDATWAYLSERLQNEIGSPERWAEREDSYTFTYIGERMEFT
jgi:hypothetical protein